MLRRLFTDSGTYTVAAAIPGMAAVFLLPIYTRYLEATDYGLVDLVTLGYTVITVLSTLEVSQGLARYLPETQDTDARRRLSSTAFWLTAGSMLLAVAIASGAAPHIVTVWLDQPAATDLWRAGALAALLGAVHGIALRQLRGSLRPRAYLAVTLLTTVTTAATTLALLHQSNAGPSALLLGQATGWASGLGLAWILARGELALSWDTAAARTMLGFSFPLVASTIGVLATSQFTRWMVAHAASLEAAGHFGIAARIALILGFASSGLQLSLSPLIYASFRQPGTPAAIAESLRIFAAGGLVLWSGLTLFAAEIVALLAAPEFQAAAPLIGPIAAAGLITTATMFAPGLELTHHTGRVAVVSLLSGGVNLLLGWWWIQTVGVSGAGAAMCVAAVVQAGLIFYFSQRHFHVPHRWLPLAGAVLIAALGASPGWLARPVMNSVHWSLRAGLFAIAAGAIWYLLVQPLLKARHSYSRI